MDDVKKLGLIGTDECGIVVFAITYADGTRGVEVETFTKHESLSFYLYDPATVELLVEYLKAGVAHLRNG